MQYIGSELQDRMKLLNINVSTLSQITFIDKETIRDIIGNRLSYKDVDEFDMQLICSALHCDTQYFIDGEARNKDLLISTVNNKKDSVKSNTVKAKIQDFMKDFVFVNDILLEKAQYLAKKISILLTKNILKAVNNTIKFFKILTNTS